MIHIPHHPKQRQKVHGSVNLRSLPSVDSLFLGLVLILCVFGLFMVYEASVVYANTVFGGKYHYVILQAGWMGIGLSGMAVLSRISLVYVRRISGLLFGIGIGFLAFLFLAHFLSPLEFFAPNVYGAHRWFVFNPKPLPVIPGIGRISFQPSEYIKFASLLFFAHLLDGTGKSDDKRVRDWIIFIGTSALALCFIAVEPDMTTAVVYAIICAALLYFANVKGMLFVVLGPILAGVATLYAFSSPYRKARLTTLLSPNEVDAQGVGYHIRQIMISLGSGGFFGLGIGHSRQKYAYLPEVTADSIFAIVGEEFGFIGTTILISLFIALLFRGYRIAQRARDTFSLLIVAGIMSWMAIQTLINIGSMVRIMPITGIPLPLISYGGSSTVFLLWGLGIVLNVSRQQNTQKT